VLSRRAFVGLATATACELAFGFASASASGSGVAQVWGLDPRAGSDRCGCKGCSACRSHAANKLFATAASADLQRAHPGCRCLVISLGQIEQHLYNGLFANSRLSVDRRQLWVQEALTKPSSQPPLQQVGGGGSLVSAGSPSATGTQALPPEEIQVAVTSARIRVTEDHVRLLVARITAVHPLQATMTITRHGKTLASSKITHVQEAELLTLTIPAALNSGLATLIIHLRDNHGHTRLISSQVTLPEATR
jgi:hypothetical protein